MKKKKCYHIYSIVCVLLKKVYIGKSCQPIDVREKSHFKGLDHSPIDDAIQQYGAEHFTVRTDAICKTPEELDLAEQKVMSDYRKLGYSLFNVFYGSGQFAVLRREGKRTYVYPNLTQASIMTGIPATQIRFICNTANSPNKEWSWADEKGKAIEAFVKQYIQPVRKVQRVRSKIRCIETGKIYDSQAAAARELGVNPKTICKALLGLRQKAAGYHWQRIEKETK